MGVEGVEGSRGSRRSRGSRGSRWSMGLRGSRVSSGLRGRGGRGGAKNQFVFRTSVRKYLEIHFSTRFIRKHLYLIPQCCIIHCNIACLALFGKFYLFPLQREWGITPSAGVVRVQILHKYKIKRINSISIYNMWMEHFRIYRVVFFYCSALKMTESASPIGKSENCSSPKND